jgi:hypothetical protein
MPATQVCALKDLLVAILLPSFVIRALAPSFTSSMAILNLRIIRSDLHIDWLGIICAGMSVLFANPCPGLVAITGPAHPENDNSLLSNSIQRAPDNSFIHNIDFMVRKSGAEIVGRRWEGKRIVDGHTLYFVFAKGIASS